MVESVEPVGEKGWDIVLHIDEMQPKSAPRPRFGSGRAYMPPEYMTFKEEMKRQVIAQGCRMLPGPVEIEVTFMFQKPKKQKNNYPLISDLDNLIKLPKDVLNGIAYQDDRYVVVESCKKVYSEIPGYRIKIRKMEGREG